MRPAHTDWVRNTLTVTGPAERLAVLRAAAAGAGVTPWAIDYDRLEENLRILMLAVPRPRRQTSLEGCRIVARELRDFVWEGHEQAIAAVGVRRHVPFDLHSLVPVPWEILRLGDEDPRAVAWLWAHWGTTWTLRHVRTLPTRGPGSGSAGPQASRLAGDPSSPCPAEMTMGTRWRVELWSADWTPWPVIRHLRHRYPDLDLALAVDTAGDEAPGRTVSPPPRRSTAPVRGKSRGAMDAAAGSTRPR